MVKKNPISYVLNSALTRELAIFFRTLQMLDEDGCTFFIALLL